MKIRILLLGLMVLASPSFGQDTVSFSSIIISGPKTRSNSPQMMAVEADLSAKLLALSPKIRKSKVVSQEVTLALARLGRLNVALPLAPDAATKTAAISLAAQRSIVEGNKKQARALIARLPATQQGHLNFQLARFILLNRGDKKEALALLRTIPVPFASLSRFDVSELMRFHSAFEVALTMAEAGDKDAAKARFDLLESRLENAEKLDKAKKKSNGSSENFMAKSLRISLLSNRLSADLEKEALEMVSQDGTMSGQLVTYYIGKNQEQEARKYMNSFIPDEAIGLITNFSLIGLGKEERKQQLAIREKLFRELFPKVQVSLRDDAIRDLALNFLYEGELQHALLLLEQFSSPKHKVKTLREFKRVVVISNRPAPNVPADLLRKWGREELLLLQKELQNIKGQPEQNSFVISSELQRKLIEIFYTGIAFKDQVTARKALSELEKVVDFDYPAVSITTVPELDFAIHWAEVGDWRRAIQWVKRAKLTGELRRLSDKAILAVLIPQRLDIAPVKPFFYNMKREDWAELNVAQVGKIIDALGAEALNKDHYNPPLWINNLPRAEQKAFALSRWTAQILPYESMIFASLKRQ